MVQITDSYVEPHSSLTLDTCALSALLVLIDAPTSYTVSVRQSFLSGSSGWPRESARGLLPCHREGTGVWDLPRVA